MILGRVERTKHAIELTLDSISFNSWNNQGSGSRVTFQGIVRPTEDGKEITSIHYECYREMALKNLENIVSDAEQKYGIDYISLVHRMGEVHPGEVSVLVDVFSRHRKEGFLCCSEIIERIKKETPIWKKFFFRDGGTLWK